MNENKRGTRFEMHFSDMPEEDLRTLITAAEQEIERRQEFKKQQALQTVLAAAQEAGMTPEELLNMATAGKRKRGGKRGAIVWRHPDSPELVYRGGRKPDWLRALEELGKKAVKVE